MSVILICSIAALTQLVALNRAVLYGSRVARHGTSQCWPEAVLMAVLQMMAFGLFAIAYTQGTRA